MSGRQLAAWLFLLPLRRPRTTWGVLLLITVAAAFGWRGVRFEPDVSQLLPQDHPHVRIAALLDEGSRPSRTLWLLLRGDDMATRLAAIAAALRQSPLVAAVAATRAELFGEAMEQAQSAPLWALADADLAELADALSVAGRARAIASLRADLADDPIAGRELAVRDPLGLRWLWSRRDLAQQLGWRSDSPFVVFADGAAIVRVVGKEDAYNAEFAARLLDHVEQVLAGTPHELFGGYAVARSDQARIRSDFERSSTWSIVAIAIYLCWVMRGLRLPLLVQLPAAMSIVWAVPLGCWWFGALPTVAVAAVAVLCGLGVDFAIHYAARYRQARLKLSHDEAVREVQRTTVPELLIDMATTAVTFLAVGFGQRGGLAAFGWLLAAGLVASALITTTAMPLLLRYVGDRRDPERSWLASLADRWLACACSRWAAGAAIVLVVGAGLVVWQRGVPLHADGEALRPANDPVLAARASIEATAGFSTIPVAVLWPLAVDASPLWATLHAMQAAGQLRFWSGLQRADTAAGQSAVAAFRERSRGFAGQARAEFTAAGFAVAELEPALAELEANFARDLAPAAATTVALGDGEQRVITVWPTQKLDREAFLTFTQAVQQGAPLAVVHGSPTVTNALEGMLRADLQRACCWAAALAVLMVTLWLRSLRHGLLALLPSAIGLVVTLFALVCLDVPLTMVSFVAIPFVLGIGVDEGVHMVGHFRNGALTTGATGVGVVRTSVGTTIGFASLLLANSPGLVQLGGIVALGSLSCMLACLFVLAPLLARASGR